MGDTTPADLSTEPQNRKPHTIPPIPIAQSWQEEIGALKEVADELAVSLWRALRNVRMWADTSPERRKGLFRLPSRTTQEEVGYACARAPQLVEAFGTFAFLLRAPGQIKDAQVAEACRQVHEWADAHSLLLTGVHFAEAAGIVAPDDPARANDAGWMCYRAALYDRAETWYRRAYGLAVQMRRVDLSTSREQSIRALLRTGILTQTLGRHEKAREFFDLAARRAARTGRRPLAAKANHDLLTYMAEVGNYTEGENYASQALDLYAHDAPQLPTLAQDFAFLLVRFHYYTYAIPLLQLSLSRNHLPEALTLAWATLARAAAGAGRRELFETAERKALSQVALHEDFAPGVFMNLGEGARALGEWDQAESYAAMALEAARQRQQQLAERDALILMDHIAERQHAYSEEPPPNADRIRLLTRRFGSRLRKWKAPGPSEPGTYTHTGRDEFIETEAQPPDPTV